jgi:hypothetical protein
MPRGFKHFAMSPTHPHAGKQRAALSRAKREKSAAIKKFSGYR